MNDANGSVALFYPDLKELNQTDLMQESIEAAVQQAKQAAGEKDVTVVGGPNVGPPADMPLQHLSRRPIGASKRRRSHFYVLVMPCLFAICSL